MTFLDNLLHSLYRLHQVMTIKLRIQFQRMKIRFKMRKSLNKIKILILIVKACKESDNSNRIVSGQSITRRILNLPCCESVSFNIKPYLILFESG